MERGREGKRVSKGKVKRGEKVENGRKIYRQGDTW